MVYNFKNFLAKNAPTHFLHLHTNGKTIHMLLPWYAR